MGKSACQTLFLPFADGLIDVPGGVRALFLQAQDHVFFKNFQHLDLYQPSYGAAGHLQSKGFEGLSSLEDVTGTYDMCLVLPPKDMVYAKFLIAKALRFLHAGGVLVVAAKNDAGGKRLKKTLQDFGLDGVQSLSKHKSKVVWANVQRYDQEKCTHIIKDAQLRKRDHGYFSQPGLYGWDKIDAGSRLLIESVPQDFEGVGADFGCGYGYLADQIMKSGRSVDKIYCLEDDARAIEAATENLKNYEPRAEFFWTDLRRAQSDLPALDFVVMNPPFHQDKAVDISLGICFIERAAESLKPGGTLSMVANTHLPYEQTLKSLFSSFEEVRKEGGFKVLKAVR